MALWKWIEVLFLYFAKKIYTHLRTNVIPYVLVSQVHFLALVFLFYVVVQGCLVMRWIFLNEILGKSGIIL